MESWGYTEVTENWEGHLPREPSRPEDSSSLMPPGLMATEVSHNVLTLYHQLLTATRLEKRPYGAWNTSESLHFSILN